MDWPASRFEAFYEAFSKRQAAESIIENKKEMVAALYSNSLMSENPEERQKAIEALEESCDNAIQIVYNGITEIEEEAELAGPFLAASKRSLENQGVPDLETFSDFGDNIDSSYNNDFDDFEVDQD